MKNCDDSIILFLIFSYLQIIFIKFNKAWPLTILRFFLLSVQVLYWSWDRFIVFLLWRNYNHLVLQFFYFIDQRYFLKVNFFLMTYYYLFLCLFRILLFLLQLFNLFILLKYNLFKILIHLIYFKVINLFLINYLLKKIHAIMIVSLLFALVI